jgi:hypothetical protein
MADPTTTRPPKPKLYKYVTVPRSTSSSGATLKVGGQTLSGGNVGNAWAGIIRSMNSLGATINSIAIITESIAKETSKTVATEIRQQSQLIKRQDKLRKDKVKRDREKEDRKRKEAQRNKDADAEKKSEGLGKFFSTFAKMTTAAVGGFFAGIVQLFEAIFKGIVVYSVLDWMSKPGNVGKLESIIKGVIGIVKVFKRLIDFGLGNALDGIAKMIEGGFSFKGLFGLFQFIIGSAVLMKTISWIKNPAKMAQDFISVVSVIIKGVMNLKKGVGIYAKVKKFMSSRAGKYVAAGAAGVGAATGSAILGGTKEEIVGTGIGAAGGAFAGEMLGQSLGGDAGGAVGAAAGSMIGGLLGGQVGKALKPVTDSIGKFFKLIGDVLKPALDFVGNIAKEYFSAVGDLINAIVTFIEPHKEILGKIVGGGLMLAFAPIIGVLKAITWLIRLFVPKSQDTENGAQGSTNRAAGGKVVVPRMASGGALVGPNQNFVDPITQRLKQGLMDAMLLPFKAVGTGLVSAFGLIGSVFGAFLPGPMQAFLGGILAPIASMFGVPNSVFKKVTGIAMKGLQSAGEVVNNATGGLLEKLMGGEGETSVTGILSKILDAIKKMHEQNGQTPSRAIGGSVPGAARGGWISGPMSGYPVSLDGGANTHFIGHGTEWVGFKRASGGGVGSAFVIPYNTPATVRTPSLTSMRMNQARAGGYALPRAAGGSVYTSLNKFATGGTFDVNKYRQGMKSSHYIKNAGGKDNSHVIAFTENNGLITFKQINKKVTDGLFSDDLTGIKPGSDEWKMVVGSAETRKYFRDQYKDKEVSFKTDPQALIYYYYNRGFKTTQAEWAKDKNITPTQRDMMALAAARSLAVTTEGQSALPGAKVKGAAPADLKDVQVLDSTNSSQTTTQTSASNDPLGAAADALSKAFEQYGKAFGNGTLSGDTIDQQSSNTKSAQETGQQARIRQEAAKVAETASKTQAVKVAPQPNPAKPVVVNSTEQNTPDINPFLSSKFGLIAQTAFDPSVVLF